MGASGRTIRTIATPEVAFGVEPQTGRVIVVEGAEADKGIRSSRLKGNASGDHFVQSRTGSFDTDNDATGCGDGGCRFG